MRRPEGGNFGGAGSPGAPVWPEILGSHNCFFHGAPFTSKDIKEALQHRTKQWLRSFPREVVHKGRGRQNDDGRPRDPPRTYELRITNEA